MTVQPFCMDVTEVTADAYAACVRSRACTEDNVTSCGPTSTYGTSGMGNHPINCVDWEQSRAFCHAQGKRIPTEEEWEWAARGGEQGRTYPWGDAAAGAQVCWSAILKRSGTCEVGSLPEGDAPGGIHDLAGNVWEWTRHKFDAGSSDRVVRGGGWSDTNASDIRASSRSRCPPTIRGNNLGFRCAR